MQILFITAFLPAILLAISPQPCPSSALLPQLVLLDHLDGRVQDRVEDPGNGEHPPDDGAGGGQEVIPRLGRVTDNNL